MGAAQGTTWGAEKHRARLRELKREHMRRWRAISSNREQERTRQRLSRQEQKSEVLLHCANGELCGFCYQRPPVRKVERLIATSRGFRRIFVPYCGVC
jgi:hypothetical protein